MNILFTDLWRYFTLLIQPANKVTSYITSKVPLD